MSRSIVSSLCLCVLAITTEARGECRTVVDAANLVSDGNLAVSPSQLPGQSFVAGVAGQLVGIEIAPLADTLPPSATVRLDVFDGTGQLLGTASRTAMGFPPGSGVVPDPLEEDVIGPGYFDLAALDITVAAGATLSFRVRHDQLGTCDLVSHRCTAGRIGATCNNSRQCDPAMRVGSSVDTYGGGTAIIDGTPDPGRDLAFKTFVETACDLCGTAPRSGCREPAAPRKALIALKDDATSDANDMLVWKWIKGASTPKSAFGQPASATTAYALCLYDAGGIVARADVPAGGTCGAKPCWSEKATGFKYKDGAGANGGIRTMLLKQGLTDGAAKIIVKGKGAAVDMPALSALASPLTVQLANSDGECWTSTFSVPPATAHDAARFKDRAD